jgi:hypothetical protein
MRCVAVHQRSHRVADWVSNGLSWWIATHSFHRDLFIAQNSGRLPFHAPGVLHSVIAMPLHLPNLWCRDSQMKALFTSLSCFMFEFWKDTKQVYMATDNKAALALLSIANKQSAASEISAEPYCAHLAQSTRICQLAIVRAGAMVTTSNKRSSGGLPAGNGSRSLSLDADMGSSSGQSGAQAATGLLPALLQLGVLARSDVLVINSGLWVSGIQVVNTSVRGTETQ